MKKYYSTIIQHLHTYSPLPNLGQYLNITITNLIKSLGLSRSPTTFDSYDFLLIFFTCSTIVNASVAEIPYLQERLTKNCHMKEFLCDN